MKKVQGNKRYKLPVIIHRSHRHVTCSTGRIVNSMTITLHGDPVTTSRGDHPERYINIKSLCCACETNITLHVNYTLI